MGLGGISIWQLLIILVIVVLLFGTKKLRSLGGDLGSAVKSFKSAVKDGEDEQLRADAADDTAAKTPTEALDDAAKADTTKTETGDKTQA